MALDGSRAQFYRVRAAQVRDTADTCKNLDIKEQLENVAKEYERLAESVERGILSR